ncbi:hypothetical protein [Rothia sp. ZJ932]|uniref:PH-like domain-containing protein n=1 Tax=Rothia sp. ZJ932 TaxID=2810516 RepID=UPI001F07E4FB|nr:hypothetical protein [Rothia sp. ZJ932]
METRLILTLICIGIVIAVFSLMWLGWRNRQRRQENLPTLAVVPAGYDQRASTIGVPGTYVATTVMGDWLDRVAVHSLGVKAKATVLVYEDALIISREGAHDLFIPVTDIIAVRTEAGMSGKFVEKDGLVMVSWQHGQAKLDTGFRTQFAEHKPMLLQEICTIAPHAAQELPSL